MSNNKNAPASRVEDNLVRSLGKEEPDGGPNRPTQPYLRETVLNPSGPTKNLADSYGASNNSGEIAAQNQQYNWNKLEAKPGAGTKPFNLNQLLVLTILCISSACGSAFMSLMAPFYPTQAVAKGATTTEVGLILGCYQLVLFIASPIYGHFLLQLGWKFMFVAGALVRGTCAILFGFLEYCPNGTIFVVMCFVVRSVEALGTAANTTANNAIAANRFPGRVSTVFGILQACGASGLMIGPPLGGLLYSAGGFKLPFLVTGSLNLLIGFLSWTLLPAGNAERKGKWGNILSLFKIPTVFVIGLVVFAGQFAIGFLDIGLAIDIQPYELSPAIVGLVFLIAPAIVVFMAPVYGWVSDRKGYSNLILIYGAVLGTLGFLLLGPSPILPEFIPRNTLWVVLVGLVVAGTGWGCIAVCFNIFIKAAMQHGLPDSMETYGVVSGTYNAFNSAGSFAGPVVGGVFVDEFGFPWASTIVAFTIAFAGFNILVFYLVSWLLSFRGQGEDKDVYKERASLVSGCSRTEKGTAEEKKPLTSEC